MTPEIQKYYADFIRRVYNDGIRIDAGDITPEVAEVCDEIAHAIIQCTKPMIFPAAVYQTFYSNPFVTLGSVYELLKTLAEEALDQWTEAIENNRQYRICAQNAALNWRSKLEAARLGI